MIQHILVLGSGTAGLLAAVGLKRKGPQVNVRVVRSPEIGTIGVGEGTTPNFPQYLFDYLGISRRLFYELAQPTWKIGVRFLWGPRGCFDYSLAPQLDTKWSDLSRPTGYYCMEDFSATNLPTALMEQGKVFARQGNGAPDIQHWHGFHIENHKLIRTLETVAQHLGVEFLEGKVAGGTRGETGELREVVLEDGRRLQADFFVDASGFRSELLGQVLEVPFNSFEKGLFCNRAVVGGWERRPDEPILPYTTAETMDSGWAWQIEHEHYVNRGYVFSSDHLSDDDAREEFLRQNPRANKDGRVVKFRSGRRRNLWLHNVVAVGNAAGFVEPLEATAIMMISWQCQTLIDCLNHCGWSPTESMRDLYDRTTTGLWDEVRDFLALHYKLNTLRDTPFWRRCREDTDLGNIQPLLRFYEENGPSGLGRHYLQPTGTSFGIEGFMVMLVGNRHPHAGAHPALPEERQRWETHRRDYIAQARLGVSVREALAAVRDPRWRWTDDAA